MATVALAADHVIINRIPDSQRQRDIYDSDDQTDRLQAKKHQSPPGIKGL